MTQYFKLATQMVKAKVTLWPSSIVPSQLLTNDYEEQHCIESLQQIDHTVASNLNILKVHC